MRSIRIIEKESKSAISKSGLPEIDFSVNPYHGCLHGCTYCFAIDFTQERDASSNWGEIIYVRTNTPELLKRELPRLHKGVIALSTITDPYQPVEARYMLSRKSAEIILRNGFFLTVQTKSPLVIRDIDLWTRYQKSLDIGITITTPDREKAKIIEPFTPSPESRFKALTKLHENGISTWMFIGPIIPGINDSERDFRKLVQMAGETESRIIFDHYNHYRGASSYMIRTFGKEGYRSILKGNGDEWWGRISGIISDLSKEASIPSVTQQDDWMYEMSKRQKNLLQY